MNYLIDTDIIIYSLKGDRTVTGAFQDRSNDPKSISVITYGELVYGARKSRQEEQNMARVRRIAEIFPVIGVSPVIIETFGSLKATLEKNGTPVADLDLIIAATALSHGLTLVTNNEQHFRRVPGLQVENWSVRNDR
jgi:tRNA(fMet)-specific endonuclease VapC